ncbi:phosphate ABC transporter ATP-binding protein PstB [Dialister micraerophilus]|uniref:phosphate ABC transporter ATP-binding protein PstB n=1 Tax=Dialister micraerophilus TaxID=309120 RepID=UPI0023F01890|nr:phosphate ABC transporter ATP-binding protein PstB [Dialister micraerophilus]
MEKHTKENENLQNISFQIKNLYLYYGKTQALKNISINIEKNKITALIGPSGCGKSTFLRTLNRMNDFIENCRVEGKILYRGKDIYNETDPISLRREVGMVFQQPNPFAKSIYDNIAYGVRLKGITKKDELDEIVEKSLKQAAIWNEVKDRLKKSALGLSGGQQQRLCIARALAMEPEILLMDESTASLDPVSSAAIEELTMKLKEKYTIIMVTHNMQQARRISDKTAFFYLGELIEYGKTENIFTTPKNERTYRYISGQFG